MMSESVHTAKPAQEPHPRSATAWELSQFRAFLRERSTGQTAGVFLTLPAPCANPIRVLTLATATPRFYWRAPEPAPTIVGWGQAAVLTAQGASRFTSIREQATALWAAVGVVAAKVNDRGQLEAGGAPLVELRLFGGFAFLPGSAQHPVWGGFQDATWVLPRFRYAVSGGPLPRAELALTLTAHELWDDAACDHALRALLELHQTISITPDTAATSSAVGLASAFDSTPQAEGQAAVDWDEQIETILAEIRAGRCSKVVLARQSHHVFDTPLSLTGTLQQLEDRGGSDVTCYAFDFGQGTFLGATPETLVNKVGLAVNSEALAGSVEAADSSGEQALLGSSKDRAEHRVVVQAIVDTLQPLCTKIAVEPAPTIRRLRHLLHLRTPISADLKGPLHVLDLVARLHPTPAVGGTPTAWAVRWIAQHESVPRGWYASPVGWFNAEGDGDFRVALRSGVMRNNEAFLYAGSGVVAGSDANGELQETQLKLASLWGALRTS